MHAALELPDPILTDAARASGPALRAFERIADRWGLSAKERQVILGLPRSTYFKVRDAAKSRLSRDTLERVSYVLGIYGALQILLPRKDAADGWVRTANDNALFKGAAPLETMLRSGAKPIWQRRLRHLLCCAS